MESVFVSHSEKDKRWRQAFDTICARAGIRSDCMEFEKLPAPPCSEIKSRIEASRAVFVIIGDDFPVELLHTNNWVAFEIGLAYAKEKDIWVIENIKQAQSFTIPILTHYILCDIEWLERIPPSPMFNHIRAMLALYANYQFNSIPVTGLTTETEFVMNLFLKKEVPKEQPRYKSVQCGKPECGVGFTLHSNVTGFSCPSCRNPIEL